MVAELLNRFENQISRIALEPSDGGRFEVSINRQLIFSKLQTFRHPETGEVAELVQKFLEESK